MRARTRTRRGIDACSCAYDSRSHRPARSGQARTRSSMTTLIKRIDHGDRTEQHTSELQSLMRIPYAVFCSTKTSSLTANGCHNLRPHADLDLTQLDTKPSFSCFIHASHSIPTTSSTIHTTVN